MIDQMIRKFQRECCRPSESPNMIVVTISDATDVSRGVKSYKFEYDFKVEESRKRFGILCHLVYTKGKPGWIIQTQRA